MGPIIFLAQLWGYPLLNARLNTRRLWYLSAAAFALVYPLVSLVPRLHNETMRWAVLLVLLAARSFSVVVGYTSLNILVNSVVEPGRRGFVNGYVFTSHPVTTKVRLLMRTRAPC
jgi:hypothetical protein